jgi:hypothetical protein
MVYDGILIGLIVGLLRAGWRSGIAALSQIKIRGGFLFPILLAIQFFLFYLDDKFGFLSNYSGYLFFLIYVAGLYVLWLNRQEKGFWWIFTGVVLNFLVMMANGGQMPVSLDAASLLGSPYVQALESGTMDTKHVLLTDSTLLPFLGDIIPITTPYPRSQIISIGDVVMNVGIFIYLQKNMLAHKMRTSFVETK